jgi:outer membrane beta-barrel protein
MNRTLWLLFVLLFAIAPAAALAAPGDGAPPDMGDDDDDDDDDDEDTAPGDSAPPSMDEDEEEEDSDPEPEADDEPADEDSGDEDSGDEDSGDEDSSDEDSSDEEAAPAEDEGALDDRYSLPPLDDSEDEAEEEAEEEPARARRSDSDFEEAEEEEEEVADEAPEKRRGLVKVIQRKFFLKYRRVEITPMIGGMLTDDFINRLAVGAMLDIHVNDILAIEFLGNFLPDLQATDYKPLTNRLKSRDEVVPEVSRIVGLFTTNLSLSPIYGKIELGTLRIINYDIYVSAGVGFVSTVDDTLLVEETSTCHGNSRQQNQALPECQYINQEHFVTSIGAGFRVVFNDFIGIRLDGRGFAHVETLYRDDNNNPEVGLDMKQNFQLSLGVSFFVPPTARTVQ